MVGRLGILKGNFCRRLDSLDTGGVTQEDSFLICKMGMVIIEYLKGCFRDSICKVFGIELGTW